MDTHHLKEHQRVYVDLSGLEAGGITYGSGLYGAGEVTEILDDAQVVVRLSMPITGKNEIVALADRLIASN